MDESMVVVQLFKYIVELQCHTEETEKLVTLRTVGVQKMYNSPAYFVIIYISKGNIYFA